MSAKPIKHFWEGTDSAGRELRAFFAQANVSGHAFVVPADMELPAIVFRALKEWKVEHYRLQERREYAAAVNEMQVRYGRKLVREPKAEGKSWVVTAYVSVREADQCKRFGTPLGLEKKFRPNMARLATAQLAELMVALDAWVESGGKRSIAKQMNQQSNPKS